MNRSDLAGRLLELDRGVRGIRAAVGDDGHAVEEIVALGEEIVAVAGEAADWVEDHVTLVLARHGLFDVPAIDGEA